MKTLALFDFDGTVYKGDSMLDFISLVRGKGFLYWSLFLTSPYIVLSKSGLIDSRVAKEKLLRRSLKGYTYDQLASYREVFAGQIDGRIYPSAKKVLEKHKSLGDIICFVSASSDLWLEPWCRNNKYLLICSTLEQEKDKITGRLKGKNCKGPEKVDRIKRTFKLEQFDMIYVYGRGRGDREMLRLATTPTVPIHY